MELEDRPPGLSGQTAVAAVEDRQRQAGSRSAMTGGTPAFAAVRDGEESKNTLYFARADDESKNQAG